MKVTLTRDNEQIQLEGQTQDIINILEYINQDEIQVPTTRNGIEVTNLGNSGVAPYIYIGEVDNNIKPKIMKYSFYKINSQDILPFF